MGYIVTLFHICPQILLWARGHRRLLPCARYLNCDSMCEFPTWGSEHVGVTRGLPQHHGDEAWFWGTQNVGVTP